MHLHAGFSCECCVSHSNRPITPPILYLTRTLTKIFQERRIYDLKKKNQELEKFKFVLDYKIKELKKQIEPREQEISDMKEQIKEMDGELERWVKI